MSLRSAIVIVATPTWLAVCAQGTFNVVHNYTVAQGWPDAGGAAGTSTLVLDSGYVVLGHQVATAGLTKDFTFRFDTDGVTVADVELNALVPSNQNFGYIDPVYKDEYGAIAAISSFDGSNDSTSQVDIARLTMDGNVAWQNNVFDTCPCGVKQLRMNTNGRVLMAGYRAFDAMLLVADTLGQIDTVRTYADTEAALSVRPLSQGGYCLAGYQLGGVDNSVWVMRLDSAGNTIWRRDIGGSRFAYQNVSAIQTQDGGIVATCSYMPLPGSPTDDQWNYFRKWDINGNVQWTKQYNEARNSTSFDLEELLDGRLVASGSETSHYGTLIELEPDGDLIWLRRYEHYLSNGSIHTPYDVEPTSDAGFVLTGRARQGPTDSLPGLDMVWLLKVDSMGCLVPGCGNIGVEEIALGLEDALHVYPNPAHSVLNVQLSLPADLQPKGDLQLVLVDALGRAMRNQLLGLPTTSAQLDLSDLPAGVYHLHLRDAVRWLCGTQVVVE